MYINEEKNANRFTGFSELYDEARPSVPSYPVAVIRQYLGKQPDLVVDLGSGTGLSALCWEKNCKQVIGIEPSKDMILQSKKKETDWLTFRQGFGNNTGLSDACADAVVCSQSFHWMEPESTLREINRILKPGGIFATIDCDWPPVTKWQAEKAYMTLYEKVRHLERSLPKVKDSFIRYSKEQHLSNIISSGYFQYCREIVFSNTEHCTPKRFVQLLLSQGSLQAICLHYPDMIRCDIAHFQEIIFSIFHEPTFSIDFSYRMRIGIK